VGSGSGGFDDFSGGTSYTATGSSTEGVYTPDFDSTSGQSDSTKDVAKEEAAHAKESAVGAAQQVAGTAKQEISNVTSEVGAQAKDLLHQTRGQVRETVGAQQSKLAETLHSVAKELGSMGSSTENPGVASDLAQQAARKVGEIGHWLENREPEDVLEQVKDFARRKPGTFLIGAALAGVIAGRLTRNLSAAAKSDSGPRRSIDSGDANYAPTTYAGTSYATPGYTGTDYTGTDYKTTGTGYTETGYASELGTSEGLGTTSVDPLSPQAPGYGRGDVTP
jgi:uncharacterized protein YjbJ (UPF0337 family)